MKKIISIILLVIFVSTNFSFAADNCAGQCGNNETCTSCIRLEEQTLAGDGRRNCVKCTPNEVEIQDCDQECTNGKECVCKESGCSCEKPTTETATPAPTPTKCPIVMGIECCEDQLLNGQCKLNVYDTLGIRQTVRDKDDATSVGLFVQDIVLSATFFIGTVVTIALIVSGLMFIFAASSGKDPANAKKGIVGSLIGLLLVVSSYVIIRLVQYIAKGF